MAANARKKRSKADPAGSDAPVSGVSAAGPSVAGEPLQIKKYANRRFYDFTRSRHLTLAEIHELVLAGHEVRISDATSGQDITNAILTQIILENEAPKLDFFPPNVLHQIIRTQRQYLGGVMDSFFQSWLNTQRQSQQRWMELMQNMFGAGLNATKAGPPNAAGPLPASALDWTRQMFSMWMPNARPEDASPPPSDPPGAPNGNEREITELRARLAELSSRLEHLQRPR